VCCFRHCFSCRFWRHPTPGCCWRWLSCCCSSCSCSCRQDSCPCQTEIGHGGAAKRAWEKGVPHLLYQLERTIGAQWVCAAGYKQSQALARVVQAHAAHACLGPRIKHLVRLLKLLQLLYHNKKGDMLRRAEKAWWFWGQKRGYPRRRSVHLAQACVMHAIYIHKVEFFCTLQSTYKVLLHLANAQGSTTMITGSLDWCLPQVQKFAFSWN